MATAEKEDKKQNAISEERSKALKMAIDKIEKDFGKGSIMRLGDKTAVSCESIPTGALSLDIALGIGGVPRGRITMFAGKESSGKSTTALDVVKNAQYTFQKEWDDEILEFANKEMGNLVLSIDGRKEIHDLMRPRRGGQGSYDEIVPKFKKVAESRNQMDYYVRGTFTRYNTDFAKDVLHYADLGFKHFHSIIYPL